MFLDPFLGWTTLPPPQKKQEHFKENVKMWLPNEKYFYEHLFVRNNGA